MSTHPTLDVHVAARIAESPQVAKAKLHRIHRELSGIEPGCGGTRGSSSESAAADAALSLSSCLRWSLLRMGGLMGLRCCCCCFGSLPPLLLLALALLASLLLLFLLNADLKNLAFSLSTLDEPEISALALVAALALDLL